MKRQTLGIWARTLSAVVVAASLGGVATTACDPVDRNFENTGGSGGSGGFGGSGQVCEPGTSEACYTGTPGTEDIGACKRGTHTCLPSGMGYDECGGEVVPTTEICTTAIDEACDGPNPVECPPLAHVWSKSFGGMGEDATTALAVDPATGDVIVTGYFRNTIDFGGNPMGSTGSNDIFLARFTADGTHLWSKRFGDAENQSAAAIVLDSTGAIYIGGDVFGSVDFGDGKPVTSKGSRDAFVAKFDPNGNVIWSRLFGDAGAQEVKDLAITPTNQIIVAGNFDGLIPLSGMELPSTNNSTDMFVIKLDQSGFDIGAKRYGGIGLDELSDVAVDSQGGVLLAGRFVDPIDFGSLGMFPSAGGDDGFVLKLKANLTEEYARIYGDADSQNIDAVVALPNDDVFVLGDFGGSVNLGDGTIFTAPPQERSVFYVALNANGSLKNGKQFTTTMLPFFRASVTVDPFTKSLVMTGFFGGTIDFGNGPRKADFADGFVAKFAFDGSHLASASYGGPSIDAIFKSAVSPTGDIFACGGHSGPVDFGGGELPAPGPDDVQALLMRLLP